MNVRYKALLGGIVMMSSFACYAQGTAADTATSVAQSAQATAPSSPKAAKKADRAANRALAKKVRLAVTKAPGIGNAQFSVFAKAKTGEVTLAGFVTDQAQDKVAVDAARQVPGVTSVTSKLQLRLEGGK
jgi:osmotically-inducible protein OsmY